MQKTDIPRNPIAFAVYSSRPFWPWVLLTFAFAIAGSLMDTATYYIFKQLIDAAVAYAGGAVAQSAVLFWVIMYPVTVAGHNFMWRGAGLSAMKWFTHARKYSTDRLYIYLAGHGIPYFNDRFAGSIANKIWNASGGMEGMFDTVMWSYLPVVITVAGTTYLISTASTLLASVFFGWIVFLLGVNYFLSKKTTEYSELRAAVKSRLTGALVDIVTNIRSVQSFSRSSSELKRVGDGTEELRKATVRSWFYGDMLMVLNAIIMGTFVISMIVLSWKLWSLALLTSGEFVMVLTILNGIIGWFTQIGQSMRSFAERMGEVEEGLSEILVPHEIVDRSDALNLSVSDGSVVFTDVTFAYGKNEVFTGFNLAISAGQRVGLVGPSGSGKTTFVALLLRQHDVQRGVVSVGGIDIRSVTQDSLHEAIAVVPQDPSLFHRSLRDNIAYGRPDATEEEIVEAAKKAQAHDFILATPDGYDTLVGERGVKLSGGQRQRVAIARAILKAAPILILDEATSSLDSESEAEIQKALHELMKGKTVIAIAHRLSTIKEMDRIIVMDDGMIVEDGTHDELVKKENGLYARLWAHQAGGFIED